MSRILLTGAGGFVGSRIKEYLEPRHEIITFAKGMLSQAEEIQVMDFVLGAQPDAIIHTAAIADMGVCERDPEASYRSNVLLTEWLCRAAQQLGVKIVCYSSDQVYNGNDPADGPYREDMPLCPANVYGRHKLEAEQRGMAACADAVMLRATWMYDLSGDALDTRGGFLPGLIRQANENRRERFSTHDFRGITWVRQVAELTEKALEIPGGAYNFGSPNNRHMADTAREALEALGFGDRVDQLVQEDGEGRLRCLAMDPAKLNSVGLAFDSTRDGFFRCVEKCKKRR